MIAAHSQPMASSLARFIPQAVEVLRNAGAQNIYVFGSVARGTDVEGSDLDLAVEGLPPENFYKAGGKLMDEIPCRVDLIDLGVPSAFVRRLRESGRLRHVG